MVLAKVGSLLVFKEGSCWESLTSYIAQVMSLTELHIPVWAFHLSTKAFGLVHAISPKVLKFTKHIQRRWLYILFMPTSFSIPSRRSPDSPKNMLASRFLKIQIFKKFSNIMTKTKIPKWTQTAKWWFEGEYLSIFTDMWEWKYSKVPLGLALLCGFQEEHCTIPSSLLGHLLSQDKS